MIEEPDVTKGTWPRGIRNCNPGNIRTSTVFVWRHQIGADSGGFCRFDHAVWGIRAIGMLFQHYELHSGCVSIQSFIRRWAPSTENDTLRYAEFVAHRLQLKPVDDLPLHSRGVEIGQAICLFENGSDPYSRDLWKEGISLSHVH